MTQSARSGPRTFTVALRGLLPLALLVLAATPARGENLLDVYRQALENDTRFQSAVYSYRADRESVPQARASLLPRLSANFSLARQRDERTSDGTAAGGVDFLATGSASYDAEQYGVQLSQALYDRGSLERLRLARSQVELAELQLIDARDDLLVRVVDRYFAVLAARDNLELARSNKRAIRRQLELAEERLDVGLGTTTDLYEAQARFQLAEADEIQSINNLDDARQALAEVTGMRPLDLAPLRDDAPLPNPNPADIDVWVRLALEGNIPLEIRRREADLRLQQIEVERSGHYPSVDFVVNHNVDDADGSISGPGIETEGTSASVRLSIPIVQGGLVVSRTREARLRHESSLRDLRTQQRVTERDTRDSYMDVTSSIQQVAALEQAVVASESALEARQEGFEAGLNTNLVVLDAQRDLLAAQRDYLRARYGFIGNRLRLERAVGALDESDLEGVNRWLAQ